jgi:hypothetical protein
MAMINDVWSVQDLLALANEIAATERMPIKQALKLAAQQWSTLEHDVNAPAGEPTALPLAGTPLVKAA